MGPDHPSVAVTLHNLAGLYRNQGRYEDATPLFLRSLAISEEKLGPDHPTVATVLEKYAILLRRIGREQEAEQLERRAARIRAGGAPTPQGNASCGAPRLPLVHGIDMSREVRLFRRTTRDQSPQVRQRPHLAAGCGYRRGEQERDSQVDHCVKLPCDNEPSEARGPN